jgi:hypothetical protein
MGVTVALRLMPLSGVTPSENGADHWQALNDDPQFGINGLENLAGTWVRFRVRLWVKDAESTWLIPRFDCGEGFLRGLTLPECSQRP